MRLSELQTEASKLEMFNGDKEVAVILTVDGVPRRFLLQQLEIAKPEDFTNEVESTRSSWKKRLVGYAAKAFAVLLFVTAWALSKELVDEISKTYFGNILVLLVGSGALFAMSSYLWGYDK